MDKITCYFCEHAQRMEPFRLGYFCACKVFRTLRTLRAKSHCFLQLVPSSALKLRREARGLTSFFLKSHTKVQLVPSCVSALAFVTARVSPYLGTS